MSKRFTDTNKWKDTWFQDLPTKYKLFWVYILDECDNAGLWKPNIRLAIFQIGEPFEESELKRVFSDRIEITESGYWFIKKFIDFQYGKLSDNSKPHISVLKLLETHKIKGYTKGIHTLKDKDKEKDKDIDKDKDVQNFEKPLSDCIQIALKDEKWIRLNSTNQKDLEGFKEKLEKEGIYFKTPIDFKTHFSRWKAKQPQQPTKHLKL